MFPCLEREEETGLWVRVEKQTDHKRVQGKAGLIIAKTVQALILAHHSDSVTTNACVSTVEQLASYLKGVGY